VPQPLAQFQATSRTREDVTKMITDLNKLTETPMKDHILAKQIQAWWPELDEKLTEIENNAPVETPPKRSAHEMLEEVLTLLRDLSRQAGALVAPGIPSVGAPPPSLTDIQALYGTNPAPSSLTRRALTRRVTPFAARAFKSILDDMGPEAIDKVAIYLSRDTQAVCIVSDLTFPATVFNHLQIDATELGFRVTFLSTEEFRRAKKLERFIQLPRDMPIEQSDPDEEPDPDNE